MAKLKTGSTAPDFTLLDQEGNEVNLAKVRRLHWVLLIFYPGDNTPGCTEQLCAIRDAWAELQAANITAYGVNPSTAQSHQAFWRQHGLKTPLLVDHDLAVAKEYDAIKKFFGVVTLERTVVLIDQLGIIQFYQRGTPTVREILAAKGV